MAAIRCYVTNMLPERLFRHPTSSNLDASDCDDCWDDLGVFDGDADGDGDGDGDGGSGGDGGGSTQRNDIIAAKVCHFGTIKWASMPSIASPCR